MALNERIGVGGDWGLTFVITAMALEARRPLLSFLVVNKPNLLAETNVARPSTFSWSEGSSRFFTL